ncbi:MAG: DegT/DnrJ/EryC1/StrS family aminotransferase [Calditrichaeota bacterium]|nr:DegT/DnrJ/EryC1/StrS family aminotransferase [Calditrichota bacterium]
MEQLALYGGPKTKTTPFGVGNRYGKEELNQLKEALEQNTLFYAHGKKTGQFLDKFKKMYGSRFAVATSSGTASIHTALAALDVGPGDEVITSPITDMGSLIGILFQNAVPIFADVHPRTYNMTAESIEARITPRTKAIEVVHLAGNPADMEPILAVSRKHGIPIAEDCAQSYLSVYRGKLAGTFGEFGCFSLNDFKHISAGDAGMILTNNENLAWKAQLFTDKGYDRSTTEHDPPFLAANYRMNELEAAVAIAQLDKLEWIVSRRRKYGTRLTEGIADLPGILPPKITPKSESSYWFYMFRVDEERLNISRNTFADALEAEGIPCGKGYIPRPVYRSRLLREKAIYPHFNWPEDFPQYGEPVEYPEGLCPVAEEVLRTAVLLRLNEFFTEQDIEDTIRAIRKVTAYFAGEKAL